MVLKHSNVVETVTVLLLGSLRSLTCNQVRGFKAKDRQLKTDPTLTCIKTRLSRLPELLYQIYKATSDVPYSEFGFFWPEAGVLLRFVRSCNTHCISTINSRVPRSLLHRVSGAKTVGFHNRCSKMVSSWSKDNPSCCSDVSWPTALPSGCWGNPIP
jgi:hypothetical protein